MTKLKIGALSDERPVKLSIELPASVHRDLLAYAKAVASESGQPIGDPGKLIAPMLAYLDVLDRSWPADEPAPVTFVVIPEFVARRWWERILFNQSARRLRAAMLGRPHTVVVDVPYRREEQVAA